MTAPAAHLHLPPVSQTPGPGPVHPAVRYTELQPQERRLLLIMEARGGVADEASLIGQGTLQDLQASLRALAALGLVQPDPSGGWGLQEAVRRRVRQDLGNAVQARLVVTAGSRVRACPPGNIGEQVLRRLCREVFSPHVVMARVPLRRALDVQVMSTVLDEPDRTFLSNCNVHLDLVVEHVETEQPLLALELDGPQHGRSPQLERDVRKDRILRVAGLPLLRLWTSEAEPPGEEMLRALLGWRLREALRDPNFGPVCPPALREALR